MALIEDSSLVDSFEKLGLSPNEAKVYLALMENHPITGYQLSKTSGILRPVVYEMLNRLVEKGGARIVKSNPDTYEPVLIEEFLKNIESDFTEAKKNISTSLKGFSETDESDYFWNVIGGKNIINAMSTAIEESSSSIRIGVNFQRYYDVIKKPLLEKMGGRLEIDVFSYYNINTEGVTLYSYNLPSDVRLDLIPIDVMYLSIDDNIAVIANFSDAKTGKAVISKNVGLVRMVKQSILNQIYTYRLWRLHGSEKMKLVLNNEDKKLLETIDRYTGGKLF